MVRRRLGPMATSKSELLFFEEWTLQSALKLRGGLGLNRHLSGTHLQRVDDVAERLGHLAPLGVPHHRVEVYLGRKQSEGGPHRAVVQASWSEASAWQVTTARNDNM